MLKVPAFYSELKKCIRKYVLRVGHRECKYKVEERGKNYWAREGEMGRVRGRETVS